MLYFERHLDFHYISSTYSYLFWCDWNASFQEMIQQSIMLLQLPVTRHQNSFHILAICIHFSLWVLLNYYEAKYVSSKDCDGNILVRYLTFAKKVSGKLRKMWGHPASDVFLTRPVWSIFMYAVENLALIPGDWPHSGHYFTVHGGKTFRKTKYQWPTQNIVISMSDITRF